MNTDIEVCVVTDLKSKQKAMYAMVQEGIPYAERWERISPIKRKRYNGAKEVCVIITHETKLESAKKIIEGLGEEIGQNIIWL